jgi:hypothetical protein
VVAVQAALTMQTELTVRQTPVVVVELRVLEMVRQTEQVVQVVQALSLLLTPDRKCFPVVRLLPQAETQFIRSLRQAL